MSADPAKPSKAERRADVALVVSYHEARLTELLERVREGFERYDSGELDAFELDELIHRYKKATRELWKFCGDITGRSAHFVARTLEEMRGRGETIDWWERGIPNVAVAERAGRGHTPTGSDGQPASAGSSSSVAFAASLADRLDGLTFDLINRHAGEALPHAGYRLASQLDAGGAFEQIAFASPRTALSQSIEQIGIDLDAGG